MNHSKLYLSTLLLSVLTTLPATASKLPQSATSASTNNAAAPSNSRLNSAQKLNQRGADFLLETSA
jgi:hypothetical protein